VLDHVDVHVPVIDRAAIRAPDGADGKGDGKKGVRNDKARADAREKEREKANVAAVRAQLAGKGCASVLMPRLPPRCRFLRVWYFDGIVILLPPFATNAGPVQGRRVPQHGC
jgi:hypothetical protein